MARVLVVGCGGIGCELVKLLPFSGAAHVVLVDMDRVELSNLNRQFIFSKESIGDFKASCCKDYLEKRLRSGSVEAVNESIIDPVKFGVPFMAKFDVVINALDNLAARQYVAETSRLSGVPLIDAGTAGLRGSVAVYDPMNEEAECFNCYSKQGGTPSFPVCTIRSRPTQPQHCVAYARILCGRLFSLDGESELDDYPTLWPLHAQLADEASMTDSSDANVLQTLCNVFDTLFDTMVKDNPATVRRFSSEAMLRELRQEFDEGRPATGDTEPSTKGLPGLDSSALHLRQIVSFASRFTAFHSSVLLPHQCFAVFVSACVAILKRLSAAQAASRPCSERVSDPTDSPDRTTLRTAYTGYSKDDDDSVLLMAALATLRAYNFGLQSLKTPFELNAIAGAIIPAVSYSNALVASLTVKAMQDVLRTGQCENGSRRAKTFFFTTPNHPTVVADDPNTRNPGCECCSQGIVYCELPETLFTVTACSDGLSQECVNSCSELLNSLKIEGVITGSAKLYFKDTLVAEQRQEGSAESSSEESGWGDALEPASESVVSPNPVEPPLQSEERARFYPGQVLSLLSEDLIYSIVILPLGLLRIPSGTRSVKFGAGGAPGQFHVLHRARRREGTTTDSHAKEMAGQTNEEAGASAFAEVSISSSSEGQKPASRPDDARDSISID